MVLYPSSSYTYLPAWLLSPLILLPRSTLSSLYEIACTSIHPYVSPDGNIKHSFCMPVTGGVATRYSQNGRKERLGAQLLANVSKPVSTSMNIPYAFTCVTALAVTLSF